MTSWLKLNLITSSSNFTSVWTGLGLTTTTGLSLLGTDWTLTCLEGLTLLVLGLAIFTKSLL